MHQDLFALVADNIVRQTEDALAEEVRPFAEMLVEQRRARRLEEDQAAARNRRRLVEPEGPVRQARTRIDQEGMILAEGRKRRPGEWQRSEEHTYDLQSLMRTSIAVFCLKKKKNNDTYEQYKL